MTARLLMLAAWLAVTAPGRGADGPASAAVMEGRETLSALLAQAPATGFVRTGALQIRDGRGARSSIPIRCTTVVTSTNWLTIYETTGTATNADRLVIVHTPGAANEEWLTEARGTDLRAAQPRKLEADAVAIPFAGSDFWSVDLGLDFFRWANPRVVRKQMRSGQFCRVLEVSNPFPGPGRYRRVVLWIAWNDNEPGGIVAAEAFDNDGRPLKEFDTKSLQKINGQWEPKELRMRNLQTGSQTILAFDAAGP